MARRKIKVSTRCKTRLPEAFKLGYAKWEAQSGDFLTFRDGTDRARFARVIGEITESDIVEGRSAVGMLLVLAISDAGHFGYERFVDPKDVLECYPIEHARTFLDWFISADAKEMEKYINDDLETRKKASYSPPLDTEEERS